MHKRREFFVYICWCGLRMVVKEVVVGEGWVREFREVREFSEVGDLQASWSP